MMAKSPHPKRHIRIAPWEYTRPKTVGLEQLYSLSLQWLGKVICARAADIISDLIRLRVRVI